MRRLHTPFAYEARCDADTLMNMTNHAYFNLRGHGDVKDHWMKIDANHITETDSGLIPNGKLQCVKEAGLDFTELRRVGDVLERKDQYPVIANAGGIDANFALNTPGGAMREIAWLKDAESGRLMTVVTDQPGVQCYSGQFLGAIGKDGSEYTAHSGLCLETQHFPDSIHHPAFDSIVLRAGETYQTATEYRFSVQE